MAVRQSPSLGLGLTGGAMAWDWWHGQNVPIYSKTSSSFSFRSYTTRHAGHLSVLGAWENLGRNERHTSSSRQPYFEYQNELPDDFTMVSIQEDFRWTALKENGFKRMEPLCVQTKLMDRLVIIRVMAPDVLGENLAPTLRMSDLNCRTEAT